MKRAHACRSVRNGRTDVLPRRDPLTSPPTTHPTEANNSKEAVMAETWSGEFYCVKCKEKRQADGEVKVNDKGTRMAKAVCPVCGTNLNRILGKA
jgi:Domain of unknown function (DUF5679)